MKMVTTHPLAPMLIATCQLLSACGGDADATADPAPASPAAPIAPAADTPAPAEPAPATAEAAPAALGLTLGGTAPMANQAMRGVDGEVTSIDGVAGEHGTLVVFTCNHCPYAVAWQERIVALAHEFAGRGVGAIAINSNDPEEYPTDGYEGMQARAAELGMRFPYVVDDTSDVARAFGATKTPEAYVFDAAGHLVYHGAIDDSQDPANVEQHYLRLALEAVATGGEVAQAETRAIGCSIKFRDAS